MTDVIVAGGGLAGLAAARSLARADLDVTLFERSETVGGRVRSRRRDGYVLDRGFQVLFTAYPAVRRELDLDALSLRSFDAGATLARPGERSVLADPTRHPSQALQTLLNHDLTLGDKLRVARLAWRLRKRSPAEMLDGGGVDGRTFLRREGFSERFVDRFAAPFFGGITLDRSLSTDVAVFEYAFWMLARGRTVVPADGMGAISDQLADRARRAGVSIETDRAVTDVDAESGGPADDRAAVTVDGETPTADAVVVATDPASARDLTGVEAIPTDARGCVTQYVSIPSGNGPGLAPRLVLNAAGGTASDGESAGDAVPAPNHVAPLSAVAPEYAPDGRELYSATFLGAPDADDEALFERVRETLEAWFPEARFGAAEHVATDRIERAQFAQPPGFRDGLPDARTPDGPIYLAGEYTRWSSIQGALESGRRAAAAVIEDGGR